MDDIWDCSRTITSEVRCWRCEDDTEMLYRDKWGWMCERCAPTRETCENQRYGCTHQDISAKCNKHEYYFCEQLTKCWICKKNIPRGTLSTHYASAHRDVTYGAGFTWRARNNTGGRHCLVTSPAGTALCSHLLDDYILYLSVRIPVPSKRLCEFRCVVRVSQPTTGHKRTYTPDIDYEGVSDWDMAIKKEDFPSWGDTLDISVDISYV